MSTPTPGSTEVENPFAGQGSVLLDIGDDVGAVVVAMPAEMEGVEVEIRPAVPPTGHVHHPHVAVVNRICEQNGLQVEITEGTDLPVFMAALANGQYDIAMSTPSLALVGAEKRLDLEIVAGLQQQSTERPNAVWLTKDPSIGTLDQLKGKTIAVPSLLYLLVLFRKAPVVDAKGHLEPDKPTRRRPTSMAG